MVRAVDIYRSKQSWILPHLNIETTKHISSIGVSFEPTCILKESNKSREMIHIGQNALDVVVKNCRRLLKIQ